MAEPLSATFFALKKRPEGGGALTASTIAFLVVMIALVAVFAGAVWMILGGDFLTWSQEMAAQSGKTTPGELPPNFGRMFLIFPIEIVWLVFVFIGLAAFESACLRWMIRGERSSPFGLHFGADMWRVYGTYWAWLVYAIVCVIAFFIVLFIAGLVGGAAGGASGTNGVGGWLAAALIFVGCLAWVFVTVRLAPAAAASVGAGKFAPFKAWGATRGRFWALFGAFFLLTIIYIIVYCIVAAVALGPFFGAIMSQLDWSTMQTDPEGFAQKYQEANLHAIQTMFSNPLNMALYFGGQIALYVVATVFYVLFYGVNARAVQAAIDEGKLEREPAA